MSVLLHRAWAVVSNPLSFVSLDILTSVTEPTPSVPKKLNKAAQREHYPQLQHAAKCFSMSEMNSGTSHWMKTRLDLLHSTPHLADTDRNACHLEFLQHPRHADDFIVVGFDSSSRTGNCGSRHARNATCLRVRSD